MRVLQTPGESQTFGVSRSSSLVFGEATPRGLLLYLEGQSSPIAVRPGQRVRGAFASFRLEFPAQVASDELEVWIQDAGLEVEWSPGPFLERLASGQQNLSSSQVLSVVLPSRDSVSGRPEATFLRGTVAGTITSNLPTCEVWANTPNGLKLNRASRMTASAASGKSFHLLTDWVYPFGGGEYRVNNGISPNTITYDLQAFRP